MAVKRPPRAGKAPTEPPSSETPGGVSGGVSRQQNAGVDPRSVLFNLEERDIVFNAIFSLDDQPALGHWAAPNTRTELAQKLRNRLLSSVNAYLGGLLKGGGVHGAHEMQAAVRFQVEIGRVADVLERSEGKLLSGDETILLAIGIRDAWTEFVGEASTTIARQAVDAAAPEIGKQAVDASRNRRGPARVHWLRWLDAHMEAAPDATFDTVRRAFQRGGQIGRDAGGGVFIGCVANECWWAIGEQGERKPVADKTIRNEVKDRQKPS